MDAIFRPFAEFSLHFTHIKIKNQGRSWRGTDPEKIYLICPMLFQSRHHLAVAVSVTLAS